MASRAAADRNRWSSSGHWATDRPLAVTVEVGAEILDRSVSDVERAARQVLPYVHQDGTPRWPLRELARVLADAGGVRSPY